MAGPVGALDDPVPVTIADGTHLGDSAVSGSSATACGQNVAIWATTGTDHPPTDQVEATRSQMILTQRYEMAKYLLDAGWPVEPPPPDDLMTTDGRTFKPLDELAHDEQLVEFYDWMDSTDGEGNFDFVADRGAEIYVGTLCVRVLCARRADSSQSWRRNPSGGRQSWHRSTPGSSSSGCTVRTAGEMAWVGDDLVAATRLASSGAGVTSSDVVKRYRFGSHVLDLDTVELFDGDDVVAIEPQAMQVLAYLIRHRQRVVPKTELLLAVWGDHFVSESALTTRIKQCRRAVGDDGRAQTVIRTVHRVGYRFVAEVGEESRGGPPAVGEVELTGSGGRGSSRSVRSAVPPVPLLAAGRLLFGRQRELAALSRRLDDHRLVTVTGTGGVGKSTLVAQLFTGAMDGLADERWWCELAATRDPGALGLVVLGAMGEGQQSDAEPVESALRVLQRREALLVLDNCEHLVADAAAFAAEVLRCCPGVRIVATSRLPLQVTGESILPLGPLGLDDSVACFCARALDAGADLDPTDATVVELCRRLDGIPLALELTAARARSLTPSQMVELLRHRFRLLADPAGNDGDRQQSLLRTIQWSWDALDAADQELLASLSTLVGPFSLEEAAAVGQADGDLIDLADALERLLQASLVVGVAVPGARRRFRLLESIHDFAAGRLADPQAVKRRHTRYFADRVQAIDDGPLQSEAIDDGLDEMKALWDNLRAAVGYAAEAGDDDTVRRIIRAVGPYADLYQSYEVLEWCAHANLDLDGTAGDEAALVADAVAVEARLLAHRGQIERARELAEAAYARHVSHATLLSVIWGAYYGGDLERVLECATRLRGLSRSERGMDHAFAEGFEAIVAAVQQRPGIDESPVAPDLASHGALGAFDCLVEGFRLATTNPVRAGELLEAVVVASLASDYRLLLGAAASPLTQITVPSQPACDAMRTVHRTLTAYRDRGMWTLIVADVVMAARLLADAGDTDVACRLLGARAASGYSVGLSELHRAALTEELRTADADRFARLTAEGASWSPPEAADVAIAALDHHIGVTPVNS